MRVPHRRAAVFIAVLAIAAGVAGFQRLGQQARPNVILITADTLRADRLGAWGYPRPTTPSLDAMAAEGVAFETAIVPRGQTWPTLASLLTSQQPVIHGVRRNGQQLAGGLPTLPEVLADHGYQRFAALSNSGEAEWSGFERIVDLRDRDRDVLKTSVSWLAGAREPFFLWVHYFAPHRPWAPPRKLARRFDPDYRGSADGSIERMNRITLGEESVSPRDLRHMLALYDAEVRFLDRLVGRLLRRVDELGQRERTLVVFTADHGEELFERNRYFSHSASVYDTVLRVPLVFRWPGEIPAGGWRREIVQTIDIAPTILELLGIAVPETFAGARLAKTIRRGGGAGPSGVAFSELEDRVVTVRTPEHRYVHNPSDFDFPIVRLSRDPKEREAARSDPPAVYPIASEELYVHATDPGEKRNVARSEAAVARGLRGLVRRWQASHGWEESGRRYREQEVPDDVRESLEALGYVR